MSCHDGATNDTGSQGHEISGTTKSDGYVDTNIGHPISFAYTGFTAGRFNASPSTEANGALAVLEGTNRVECSSCHDIHGTNVNSDNYAIRATTASATTVEDICLSCHIK
jgi:nitrate/TMAO reductase-like tetraheme cytochrome c subunit